MDDACPCGAGSDRDRRKVLAFLGAAMVATCQPVDEVEDELREMGRHLGAPAVQVAAAPTGVQVALASGEPTTFKSVDGRLRLEQVVGVLGRCGRPARRRAAHRAAAARGVAARCAGGDRAVGAGWWAAPLGLLVIGVGITLLEGVPLRLSPWVFGVLVVTFLVQLAGQRLGAPVLGSFLGAVAASVGASAAELVHRRLPRLVVFLPSFWLLVPGSLGLIGVSEVAIESGATTVGRDVVGAVLAIATGLLVGSVVSRALRGLVGRVSGSRPRRTG